LFWDQNPRRSDDKTTLLNITMPTLAMLGEGNFLPGISNQFAFTGVAFAVVLYAVYYVGSPSLIL